MRYFPFLLLLTIACTNDITGDKNQHVQDLVPNIILIFLKEQTIEYWGDNTLIKTQNITAPVHLPIGYFRLDSNKYLIPQLKIYNQDSINLYLPDDILFYYHSSSEVFIFPNDARNKAQFEPCMRCPYQVAELYSTLWLYLQAFKKDNNESN
jgi:hypothetical protein